MPVTNAATAGGDEALSVWAVTTHVHRALTRHEIGGQLAGAPDTDVLDGWTRTICAVIDDVHRQLTGLDDRTLPSWRLAADAVVWALDETASLPWHLRQGSRTNWRKALVERGLALASIPARITLDNRKAPQ